MTKHEEIFVITMEECRELIQVCSKPLRQGASSPKPETLSNLRDEVGDVLCMIDLLISEGYIKEETLEERIDVKREKLTRYSKIFGEPDER
jgi:NTP pyrophosphatase (non-canonical NTP hydrolase)